MAETQTRSMHTFGDGGNPYVTAQGSMHSPSVAAGKSVYMASETGSDKRFKKVRLGGVKSSIRALKNVKPFAEKGKRSLSKKKKQSVG